MNPQFQITHRAAAGLTRIERARGFLDAARLSEDWLDDVRELLNYRDTFEFVSG